MNRDQNEYNTEYKDDGRTVADMSDVTRTPLLIPRLGDFSRDRHDIGQEGGEPHHEPVYLDKEERRYMIGGAVSAALLVGGTMALAFAGLILLILKLWG